MEKSQLFQRDTCIIAVLSVFLLIPWLGDKDFYTRGESREALVAQRMMITGDYILPSSYDDVVPSKPPLLHWLINIASIPFGEVNEFSSRFPSAISVVVFLIFFQRFLLRNQKEGLLPPLILITSFEWFRAATTTRVDALLSVCFAAGLFTLFDWYKEKFRGIPWLSILILSGASLTKGPVGLVLPVSIFGLFLLIERVKFSQAVIRSLTIAFPVGLIALAWYAVAYVTDGDRFLEKVYYENIARFTGTMEDEPHKHGVGYLYGMLLVGFMPWTLILIPALLKGAKSAWIYAKECWVSDSLYRFSVVTALSIVCFFSIPESKRGVYLLPAYPSIALLLAVHLSHIVSLQLMQKAVAITAWVLSIVFVGFALLFWSSLAGSYFPEIASVRFLNTESLFSVILNITILLISIAALRWVSQSLRQMDTQGALVQMGMVFFVSYFFVQSTVLSPFANTISYKSFASETFSLVEREERLYSYLDAFYGVSFYLRKQFYSAEQATEVPDNGLVYVFERNLDSFSRSEARGREIQVLARSSKPVVKMKQHMLLIKVVPRV